MGYYFLLGRVRLCVLIGYGHGPLCACECPKERQRVDESNNVCPDQPMGGAESLKLLMAELAVGSMSHRLMPATIGHNHKAGR